MKGLKCKLLTIIAFMWLISCHKQNDGYQKVSKQDSINKSIILCFDALLNSNLYTNNIDDLNDSGLFVFVNMNREEEDSWVFIARENKKFVDIECRFIPAWFKTGYDGHLVYTKEFAFYECYKVRLDSLQWKNFILQSKICDLKIRDSSFDIADMQILTPLYLIWYNKKLLVNHDNFKNKHIFMNMKELLMDSVYSKIDSFKKHPIAKFKNGTPYPRKW